jgi:hypothetical protein
MSLWLNIYLTGCFATIVYGVYLHKTKNFIEAGMLWFLAAVSILSWTGLLAIFVGYNAKRNR